MSTEGEIFRSGQSKYELVLTLLTQRHTPQIDGWIGLGTDSSALGDVAI